MSSNRQRIQAALEVAEATGKPLDAVLQALAPTWGVDGHELAALQHMASSLPKPPTTEQKLTGELATRAAAKLAIQDKAQADARAVLAFQNYQRMKQTNPHVAALQMNANGTEINRGRELASASENPEPPEPQAA